MAVVLLKLVFTILSALSNLITRLIFTGLSQVLVQMILTLKGPGEGGQRILEMVRDTIKTCLGYVFDVIIDVFSNITSSVFDLVKDGFVNSSSGLVGGVLDLMEKSKTSLGEMLEGTSEIVGLFAEMIGKIVIDFLNNCNDAIAYVTENVLN